MEVDEGSTTGDNCQELDLTFLQRKIRQGLFTLLNKAKSAVDNVKR